MDCIALNGYGLDIYTMLSLPIHELRTSLHLFRSLMSVFRVLEFSVCKFCTCSVKLCPSISFWINFKFSFKLCFWTCSLLVYRKTLDFCMLLFSPAAFPNLLINCTLFLLASMISVRNLLCLNSFPLHVSVGSLSLFSRFSLCF